MTHQPDYRAYWEQNIDRWADLYLDISHGHETFDRPAWLTALYNATLAKHERKLMRARYQLTVDHLRRFLKQGDAFSDIGCGNGIFVVEAVKIGIGDVNAMDFSEASLAAARRVVAQHAPLANVRYIHADIQKPVDLPKSDLSLAMGLTPYLSNMNAFWANVLPQTKTLICHYIDPYHWASRIRTAIPILNVRELRTYDRATVDAGYARHNFTTVQRTNFATGFVDVAMHDDLLHDWPGQGGILSL